MNIVVLSGQYVPHHMRETKTESVSCLTFDVRALSRGIFASESYSDCPIVVATGF